MQKISENSVLASEIADFLGKKLSGENVVIYGPSAPSQITDNSIFFIDDAQGFPADKIKAKIEVLTLLTGQSRPKPTGSYIITDDPAADFIRVINKYFARKIVPFMHPSAVIESGSKLGQNVGVYAGAFIGPEVEIGDNTMILQNVVITGKVKIGKNCVVKANATIGSEIFDFAYADGAWQQFPQIGRILIADDVWIGANSTIEKGSLTDTVIERGVRIDDLVQIGNGSRIGQDSIVAAGAVICSHVEMGKKCWIAPNSTVREKTTLGEKSFVGLGSVVIADVAGGKVVAGNPAKPINGKSTKK